MREILYAIDWQIVGRLVLAFVCWLALFALAMNRVRHIRPRKRCRSRYWDLALVGALSLLALSARGQALVITKGGTYANLNITWTDSTHPAILVNTKDPVTITDSQISSPGPAISTCDSTARVWFVGANVTITNCVLTYTGGPSTWGAMSMVELQYVYFAQVDNNTVYCTPSSPGLSPGGVLVRQDGSAQTAPIDISYNAIQDGADGISIAGCNGDPNAQIACNYVSDSGLAANGDHINIYESSGQLGINNMIWICGNLVVADPAGPQVIDSADIQAGDTDDYFIYVAGNTCINGTSDGVSFSYSTGDTCIAEGNTVVGLGYSQTWSAGIAIAPHGGASRRNQVIWWDTKGKKLFNYTKNAARNKTNQNLPASSLSAAYEQQLVSNWFVAMTAQGHQIGATNVPLPQPPYPSGSAFPVLQ